MLRVPMILLLSWNVAFLKGIGPAVAAEDECSSNSDCESSFGDVCCRGYSYGIRRKCRYGNCFGRYCSTDGDCGGVGECCRFSKCTTSFCSECLSNFACASSEYCCKLRYINDHNVCRRSCVGETCHSDSDCGGLDETCGSDHECKIKTSKTVSAAWVAPVVIVGLVVFAIVVGGVFAYRCCRKTSQRGTVIAQRPAQRTAAIIALRETEVKTVACPPPVYNSPPPPYFNHGQDISSPAQPQPYYPPPQQYPPPQHQPYPAAQPQQYPMQMP